jgi:class 3 adenylate cyclase
VWRETLDSFRRLVRQVIDRYGAQEVNTRGDDFFAIASSPSIAIAIARDIRTEAATLDLQVRSGIHLGEVEHQEDDYRGLTVHIGARIAELAAPGEILIYPQRSQQICARAEIVAPDLHLIRCVQRCAVLLRFRG